MANIFSLYGSIFIDNEKANKAIDETTKKGKEQSKTFGEKFGEVSATVGKIATSIVGVSTTIVGGLTAMANKTSETADTFDKASLRTGLHVEELQRLNYAAGQSGVSLESLEKSAKKMNERLGEISEGNDKTTEIFKKLGVSVKNSNGEMLSSTSIYSTVLAKLADMGDTAEATAIGTDLFGKAFVEMKPLLAEGSLGIQELKERADELGIVMGQESVDAGVKFGDTMADIKSSLGGAFNKVMGALIPVIQKLLDLIIKNMPLIQKMIDSLAPILVGTLESILPVFVDFVQMIFPLLVELMNELLPPISEIIKMLLPILSELLAILLPPLIEIIRSLLPVLMPILKALIPLLTPILELLSFLINIVLTPIIKVVTGIANVLSVVLVGAINILKPVLEGLLDVFKTVFGAIANIVKAPINFIIDGINSFIKMLNKIKIPDWVPFVGGKGFTLPTIPKLKVGLDYVPYDDFPALLHRGERVMTAKENNDYKENKQTTSTFTNNITIEKMEVRDDKDIQKIAEELYYLQKKVVI